MISRKKRFPVLGDLVRKRTDFTIEAARNRRIAHNTAKRILEDSNYAAK